jgi:hypothetical protein
VHDEQRAFRPGILILPECPDVVAKNAAERYGLADLAIGDDGRSHVADAGHRDHRIARFNRHHRTRGTAVCRNAS